jgi:hypothetical protein
MMILKDKLLVHIGWILDTLIIRAVSLLVWVFES